VEQNGWDIIRNFNKKQGRKARVKNDTAENCVHGTGIEFSEEETETAIKTSLNGKSRGPGRIIVGLLKTAVEKSRRALANAA
jgi:hypothetical protein